MMPIAPPPGICLSASSYAVGKDLAFVSSGAGAYRQGQGRWGGGMNVEFIAGFPQKIAGWSQASATLATGIPRAEQPWRDNIGDIRVAIGTTTHLYYMLAGVITDITPLRTISLGTLTNPITTTANDPLVSIADSTQRLVNGDWVFLSAASSVGGLTLDNWYQVSSRTGTGYQVTVPVPPTSSAGPGGGAVTFQYPRVTLSNPFTTTTGSATVTVTHANDGAQAGNYVDFSGASSVGGLVLNGEYEIVSIIDSGHYTITAASAATGNATGGGSVSVTYDIQVEQANASTGIGYGQGNYGQGNYGVGLVTAPVLADGWTLAAYGSQMLAAPIGGTIYVFDPAFGGRAYPLLNAPATLLAMFVTPERFVVALGINGNLLEMAWCDQQDYTDWTTLPTNTANSGRTLIGGSYFVGGIGVRDGVSLIWTDNCVFNMNYTGDAEVYATPQIGDNCGLVSPWAVCVEGQIAYWISDQDFWSWNGGVSVLPSDDIRTSVFGTGNINRQFLNKCAAVLNRAKRQVRFWYPDSSAMENNVGVIYHYDQQCWGLLGFGKSCGADAELLPVPVSGDIAGTIYYDETGVDANGAALFTSITMGELDLSNGDRNADLFGFIPDFQTLSGPMDLTINTVYFAPALPLSFGPYTITQSGQRQDLRADGKAFSFTLAQNAVGASFRLGVPRLDVSPAGARR